MVKETLETILRDLPDYLEYLKHCWEESAKLAESLVPDFSERRQAVFELAKLIFERSVISLDEAQKRVPRFVERRF